MTNSLLVCKNATEIIQKLLLLQGRSGGGRVNFVSQASTDRASKRSNTPFPISNNSGRRIPYTSIIKSSPFKK